ncbi:hypothetical protein FPHYL_781 [Fusarium phyllophilum]|uniref:2EXR domain-containing protein n=1 Tax=Fusarium phyllophilum TaxID=47803 RepID=A0A8H5KFE4_9HYPO|nr:hypothetical protein FPHYL_781 [Fusarium phyllophilum]
MFTLFPKQPPELRDQIWYHALSEPRQPGICHWKPGCWIPKYLTAEDHDWSHNRPNNIRLEFRYDKLGTPVHIPIVDVNQEARRVALAWARDNNIRNRYKNGKYEFRRRMDKDRDTMYFAKDMMEAAQKEAINRRSEDDLRGWYHPVATYITSFAVSERFMRIAKLMPYTWETHKNLERIYVIVGKQPDQKGQWEIDTTRGASFLWTRETSTFIPQLGVDEFCSGDLFKTIMGNYTFLRSAALQSQGPARQSFEIRVCSAIRRSPKEPSRTVKNMKKVFNGCLSTVNRN